MPEITYCPVTSPPDAGIEVILFTKLSEHGWDWWQAYFSKGKWWNVNGQELIVMNGSVWGHVPHPPVIENAERI